MSNCRFILESVAQELRFMYIFIKSFNLRNIKISLKISCFLKLNFSLTMIEQHPGSRQNCPRRSTNLKFPWQTAVDFVYSLQVFTIMALTTNFTGK